NWKIGPEMKWAAENPDLAGIVPTVPYDLLKYITGFAASPKTANTGGTIPAVGTDSTPVNTEFYYAEIEVAAPTMATGISVRNGSVVSGNIQAALFDSLGRVVAICNSAAQAGVNLYQRLPFTGRYFFFAPGTYYLGVMVDNSTARIQTHA